MYTYFYLMRSLILLRSRTSTPNDVGADSDWSKCFISAISVSAVGIPHHTITFTEKMHNIVPSAPLSYEIDDVRRNGPTPAALTKNQRVKRRTENEVIIEIMALRALVVSYCRTSIILGFGEHI